MLLQQFEGWAKHRVNTFLRCNTVVIVFVSFAVDGTGLRGRAGRRERVTKHVILCVHKT